MKKIERLVKEKETTKNLIKFVEKGYGKDKCKGYAVGCSNCEAQIFLGHLYNHLDLLNWMIKDEEGPKTKGNTRDRFVKQPFINY